MLLLTIVYNKSLEYAVDGMYNIKEYFKIRNKKIVMSEQIGEGILFLKIFCEDEKFNSEDRKLFDLYIANVIYKVVINEFYKKHIDKVLEDMYFFLKNEEKDIIKNRCLEVFNYNEEKNDEDYMFFINKKNAIIKIILECIEENNEINIDGFLRFRSAIINEELDEILDKIIEKYMVEKEYDEFIKILKYFADIQDSKIDVVNILIDKSGKYIVTDKNDENIEKWLTNSLEEVNNTVVPKGITKEDMLISGLIASAPKSIIIHGFKNCKNKEFIKTLNNVFGAKTIMCDGCKICKSISKSMEF